MATNNFSYTLSKVIMGAAALYFLYLFIHGIGIVNRRYMGTENGTYINNTRSSLELKELSIKLTKDCPNDECRVQKILDYVTNIPYVLNNFNAHKPLETVENNFGDCDDKSNLLISLLHESNIEAYFVLVPKHIFVIVPLEGIESKNALYLNGRAYYILESTAKDSKIGYPLSYRLDEISTIFEPFENRKLNIDTLTYK